MSASVARVADTLHLGRRSAVAVVAVGLLVLAALAALATRQGVLPIAIGGVLLLLAVIVGLRAPLALLMVFAALIPIEEVFVIDGLGTVSRVAGLLFAITYAAPRLSSLKLGAMPVAGWAYVAWAVASVGWATSPDVAGGQLPTLVQLFVIAVFTADFVVRQPSIVRPVLWAYSLSAAATAALGVAAYVAQGLASARSVAIENQDPAQFAAVLLPAVVFGLYEVIGGRRRALGGAIALITTAGVIVSGTRGAWVALVVVVLFVLLPQLSPRRRVVALATIAALSVVVYQLPGVADLIAERTGNAVSTGGAGRTDIWTVGLTIFGGHPVAGVGFANFPVAFTTQVIRDAGVGWEWLGRAGAGSHNVIVSTSVELGIVGLVLLALFALPLMLRRGWGPEAITVQAALVSLFTTALFLDILANRKQVWLVLALAAGLAYLARTERGRATEPEPAVDAGPSELPAVSRPGVLEER